MTLRSCRLDNSSGNTVEQYFSVM